MSKLKAVALASGFAFLTALSASGAHAQTTNPYLNGLLGQARGQIGAAQRDLRYVMGRVRVEDTLGYKCARGNRRACFIGDRQRENAQRFMHQRWGGGF